MGKIYGNRWQVIMSVGEGGQGKVFKVLDKNNGSTDWVLKELKNNNRLRRFEREIKALQVLDSPYIPRIEDYSINCKPFFIVFPNLGKDLKKIVVSNPLSVEQALSYFLQTIKAVRDAHKGEVVHRDIKPNNIIISQDGLKAFLIDFGICQYADGKLEGLTVDEPLGNQGFAAPECFLGNEEEPGPPCDVYSLGKLLYWMVSNGKHIHRESIKSQIVNNINHKNSQVRFYISRLIRGTVKEDPKTRWPIEKLLEEVEITCQLIERIKQIEDKGLVVVVDNFGLDYLPYKGGSQRITNVLSEDSQEVQDVGIAFKIIDSNVKLDEIIVALTAKNNNTEVEIQLVSEIDGKPYLSQILESFQVNISNHSSPISIKSIINPALKKDSQYWLLFSMVSPEGLARLWTAPLNFMPQSSTFSKRTNGGDWRVLESISGPGYAIRIIGHPLT